MDCNRIFCGNRDRVDSFEKLEASLNTLLELGQEPRGSKQLEVELMKPTVTFEFSKNQIRQMVLSYLVSNGLGTLGVEDAPYLSVDCPDDHLLLVEFRHTSEED